MLKTRASMQWRTYSAMAVTAGGTELQTAHRSQTYSWTAEIAEVGGTMPTIVLARAKGDRERTARQEKEEEKTETRKVKAKMGTKAKAKEKTGKEAKDGDK